VHMNYSVTNYQEFETSIRMTVMSGTAVKMARARNPEKARMRYVVRNRKGIASTTEDVVS
jgi:hypothetical protein